MARSPIAKDLPEDPLVRCGWGPFSLPESHPFTPACALHDNFFELKDKGQRVPSRKQVDDLFLDKMLGIAGGNLWLKAQAYTMYGIARAFGGLFW